MGNLTARELCNLHETILVDLPQRATTTMDKSSTHEGRKNLVELPESCISAIFSFTTPRDICRLSAVSKVFRSVAYDDSLWNKFIPQKCYEVLPRAVIPVAHSSKRELYFRLCESILIDRGTKRFWLERSTGKIGYMLSARHLDIICGEDQRYWQWPFRQDSRFEEVAESLMICWLEVQGGIDCRLLSANTVYKVVFLLKFGEESCGWSEVPIRFSVITPDGNEMELEEFLMEGAEERKRVNASGWMEVVAGEFTVRAGEDNGDGNFSVVRFAMNDEKLNWWKSGLLIHGVTIEPLTA
eukprot:PITA_19950